MKKIECLLAIVCFCCVTSIACQLIFAKQYELNQRTERKLRQQIIKKANAKTLWLDTLLNSGKPQVRILENGILTFKPYQNASNSNFKKP